MTAMKRTRKSYNFPWKTVSPCLCSSGTGRGLVLIDKGMTLEVAWKIGFAIRNVDG